MRGSVRADGASAEDVWNASGLQWHSIEGWAAERGLILPATFKPDLPGGREHDVRFDPASRRWIKFTKPAPMQAGFTVHVIETELLMLPATPLEYLERWNTHNRVFGDSVELVGFQNVDNRPRLIISQPHVPGEPASWTKIEETFLKISRMNELRIPRLLGGYDSKAYFKGRIGIFDVRPLNCFLHATTLEVAAFDVIPKLFSRAEADQLKTFVLP